MLKDTQSQFALTRTALSTCGLGKRKQIPAISSIYQWTRFAGWMFVLAAAMRPLSAQAAWTYDFRTNGLDPNYWSTYNPNGTFTFTPSGSGVVVAGGHGSFQTGKLLLNLGSFPSLTDFDMAVTFIGAQLSGGVHQVQIEAFWPPAGVILLDRSNQASVGSPGGNTVNVYDGTSVLALTPVGASEGTSASGTLRLTRSGSTFTGYWNGQPFWTGHYSASPLNSVTLSLNDNYGATDPTAVTWQSFSINPGPVVPTKPTVSVSQVGGSTVITFYGTLQQSPSLAPADFQDVPGNPTSPYTVPLDQPQQFYRARLTK